MMQFYKEGDKSKAICSSCKKIVITTFKVRVLDIKNDPENYKIWDVLVAACDICDQTVAVPQQSFAAISLSEKEIERLKSELGKANERQLENLKEIEGLKDQLQWSLKNEKQYKGFIKILGEEVNRRTMIADESLVEARTDRDSLRAELEQAKAQKKEYFDFNEMNASKLSQLTQEHGELIGEFNELKAHADALAEALEAMIGAAKDKNCGLRIADEALAAYKEWKNK